jgi:hypothetical protein
MGANLASATRLGLVGWNVDTWTLRPALDVQYVIALGRTIVTLSSDPTYFHTESFKSSGANFGVNGDSGSLANKGPRPIGSGLPEPALEISMDRSRATLA